MNPFYLRGGGEGGASPTPRLEPPLGDRLLSPEVPSLTWSSFYQFWKDAGLNRLWSHQVDLNMRHLDCESSASISTHSSYGTAAENIII